MVWDSCEYLDCSVGAPSHYSFMSTSHYALLLIEEKWKRFGFLNLKPTMYHSEFQNHEYGS